MTAPPVARYGRAVPAAPGSVDDRRVYGLHGLRLRSPVPVAGFAQAGAHDVDIVWGASRPVLREVPPGRLVLAATAGDSWLYVATESGGRWILRVGGVCDFVIDARLGVVECRPDPAADPDFVAVLVAGLVVAFLLTLAGHCVLHASAVEVDGGAVAFAGASGAGKSTLAALLCATGARLVADDVLRLGVGEVVSCVGGGPQLRLRPGSRWALDQGALAPAGLTVDGRLSVRPPPSVAPSLPLSAIFLPRLSRGATEVDLRPTTGAASVTALAAACRVVGWKDPEVLRAQFRALTEVAARVPVVEAVIPWGSLPSPAILDRLRSWPDGGW